MFWWINKREIRFVYLIGINISNLAVKASLTSLKTEADKIEITKLKLF